VYARGLLKSLADPSPSHFLLNNIHEISEGGLSFLTDEKVETGMTLTLAILVHPEETSIEIRAIVVRCPEIERKPPVYQTGLRFTNISENQQAIIRNALKNYSRSKKKSLLSRFVIRLRG